MSSVTVVRGAGAFGGYHGRAQRLFGSTLDAEGRAFEGLPVALQHLTGDARFRLVGDNIFDRESAVCIEACVGIPQSPSAFGDFADATPLARNRSKDLVDLGQRCRVAFRTHDARVLIFQIGSTLFQFLRAPMLAAPDSLDGQLAFIRDHWAGLLPDQLMAQLDRARVGVVMGNIAVGA